MYGNRIYLPTAFSHSCQWIALSESYHPCYNTRTKSDNTNIGIRRVLLVSIDVYLFLAVTRVCVRTAPNGALQGDGRKPTHTCIWVCVWCWCTLLFCFFLSLSLVQSISACVYAETTNWMQSIRIGNWWCNVGEFWLAPMATGVVFSISMDNCILLSGAGDQKCWKSGLFYGTISVCHFDGTSGNVFSHLTRFVCLCNVHRI